MFFTQNSRSIFGTKNANFSIKSLARNDKSYLFFTYYINPETKVLYFVKANSDEVCFTKDNKKPKQKISLIIPIKTTEIILLVNNKNQIFQQFFSNKSWNDFGIQCKNIWSVSYAINNNEQLYLIFGNNANQIVIKNITKKGNCFLLNIPFSINTCTSLFNNENKLFIALSVDKKICIIPNLDLTQDNINSEGDLLKDLSDYFNIESKNINTAGFIAINEEKTHIAFTTQSYLNIIKLEDLLEMDYNKKQERKKECISIELSSIKKTLYNKESNCSLNEKILPFILTKKHVIFNTNSFSYDNGSSYSKIVAYSLSTGKLSDEIYFPNMKIYSLSHSQFVTDEFTICTDKEFIAVDFSHERDSTEVIVNHFDNSEILLRFLKEKDLPSIKVMLEDLSKDKKYSQREKEIIKALSYEISLINNDTSFADDDFINQCDIAKDIEYLAQKRTLSFIKERDTLLNFDSFKQLEEDPKLMKNVESLILKNPNEVLQTVKKLEIEDQKKFIDHFFIFIIGNVDSKLIFDMIINAIDQSDYDFTAILISILSRDSSAKDYDEELAHKLSQKELLFTDITDVNDSFEYADMKKCIKVIQKHEEPKIEVTKPREEEHVHKGDIKTCISKIEEMMDDEKTYTNNLINILTKTLDEQQPLTTTTCAICKKDLTNNSIVFNCSHGFHEECLENALKGLISTEEQQELESMKGRELTEEEKERRDDILLQDCPLCGEIAFRDLTLLSN